MNIGKVEVRNDLILQWLHFEGGEIRGARLSPDKVGIVELMIEHVEMPEVQEADLIPFIAARYKTDSALNINSNNVIREPIATGDNMGV